MGEGISHVCQGHMILACDVSAYGVVIIILVCDVSGMCGGISQVCQGRKKTKMTYVTQTG